MERHGERATRGSGVPRAGLNFELRISECGMRRARAECREGSAGLNCEFRLPVRRTQTGIANCEMPATSPEVRECWEK